MRSPPWAISLGLLLNVLGFLGILGSLRSILLFPIAKGILEGGVFLVENLPPRLAHYFSPLISIAGGITSTPEWYQWSFIIIGILTAVCWMFAIIAGWLLFYTKISGIKILRVALPIILFLWIFTAFISYIISPSIGHVIMSFVGPKSVCLFVLIWFIRSRDISPFIRMAEFERDEKLKRDRNIF